MNSISQWCGRFGNNIQQISNAILYCERNKLKFISPNNDLINEFSISFGSGFCFPNLFFFHVDSITGQGYSHFDIDLAYTRLNRRRVCLNYIRENLKINNDEIKKLDHKTIVIHVRSGDIFNRKNYYCPVVSRYLQNPLYYYLEIIKDFDEVIVLTEDNLNPVLNELNKIDKITIKICSLQETIQIMLSARNLATSGISSFPIACALLSNNIENIYCSNFQLDEIISYKDFFDENVNIHIFEIDENNYIKSNEWLNTDEQRKMMIEYGIKNKITNE